jgi:hypothetical protein
VSGDATFAGTTYQGRAVAFVYVHILAQMPLGWLPNVDDTPNAVSGETRSVGDDIQIEIAGDRSPVEVQAKHGLNAAGDLDELVAQLRDDSLDEAKAAAGGGSTARAAGDQSTSSVKKTLPFSNLRFVLVVDRGSTRALYTHFAEDLTRLRTGRDDGHRPTLRLTWRVRSRVSVKSSRCNCRRSSSATLATCTTLQTPRSRRGGAAAAERAPSHPAGPASRGAPGYSQ